MKTKKSIAFSCPLVDAYIDPVTCQEVQDCVDGLTEPNIITEDFLEKAGCREKCIRCKYRQGTKRKIKTFLCPLVDSRIIPATCLEVQESIDGIIEPTTIIDEFWEKEDFKELCSRCKYHL